MSPADLLLIRSTFALVATDPEPFARAFRDRAVDRDRTVAAVLPETDRVQASRIVETIALVLQGLDVHDSAPAKAQTFALRHRWAGIRPHHFGVIGQALLGALSDRIGPAFRDEHRAAWAHAFVELAEALMARCSNPLGLVA